MMSELAISSPLISTLLGFVPGAVGGTLNILVGHPMDLIKVRQQTCALHAQQNSVHLLRTLALSEGLPGLYAGLAPPLCAVVPAFAVTFASYDAVAAAQVRYFHPNNNNSNNGNKVDCLTLPQIAFAGACTGVPLGLTIGPLERFKCLLQTPSTPYTSFRQCFMAIYRQEGWRGIFRGTSATILRDVPGNAAYFATYEGCKRLLMQWQQETMQPSISTTLLAGGLAGMMNWTVAIPFDVLKSKWQTAPSPDTYRHVGCVLKHVLQTEGPTALFHGLGPALLRAFPANAACLLGVETARSFLRTDR